VLHKEEKGKESVGYCLVVFFSFFVLFGLAGERDSGLGLWEAVMETREN